MMRKLLVGLSAALLVLIFFHQMLLAEETGHVRNEISNGAGRALYEQHCARCHGLDGQANGPDAKHLFPKPRDLMKGSYKFRSTESGTPPTDEDLFRTLSRGLPGSAMPAFEEFSEAERRQLVAYIKSLSQTFAEKELWPVTLTADPGAVKADLMKGKQLYNDLGCLACHGTSGRANGPSAKGLVDADGKPIRAVNLTQGWTYRGGSDPSSIMMRILTGIDGTPMPSYAEAVPMEDFWHLSYYVHSLQEEAGWGSVINAIFTEGSLPSALQDPAWVKVPRTDVSVGLAEYQEGAILLPTVKRVSIQALHDGQTILLRLVWDDPTEDRDTPPDALGLVFKPEGVGDIGSLSVWPLKGSPPLDVIYWSSDLNQIRKGASVGFAPVATGQTSVEILPGEAVYEDGRWTLFFRYPLTPDRSPPFAIAIWNGGNGEARKIRSSSAWLELFVNNP